MEKDIRMGKTEKEDREGGQDREKLEEGMAGSDDDRQVNISVKARDSADILSQGRIKKGLRHGTADPAQASPLQKGQSRASKA